MVDVQTRQIDDLCDLVRKAPHGTHEFYASHGKGHERVAWLDG
jgi:hypothetical protein